MKKALETQRHFRNKYYCYGYFIFRHEVVKYDQGFRASIFNNKIIINTGDWRLAAYDQGSRAASRLVLIAAATSACWKRRQGFSTTHGHLFSIGGGGGRFVSGDNGDPLDLNLLPPHQRFLSELLELDRRSALLVVDSCLLKPEVVAETLLSEAAEGCVSISCPLFDVLPRFIGYLL